MLWIRTTYYGKLSRQLSIVVLPSNPFVAVVSANLIVLRASKYNHAIIGSKLLSLHGFPEDTSNDPA